LKAGLSEKKRRTFGGRGEGYFLWSKGEKGGGLAGTRNGTGEKVPFSSVISTPGEIGGGGVFIKEREE